MVLPKCYVSIKDSFLPVSKDILCNWRVDILRGYNNPKIHKTDVPSFLVTKKPWITSTETMNEEYFIAFD